jgi:hypothetical protein
MNHTPGPWHRNIRANGKYPVVFAGRNQHVAKVEQQSTGAETEANIDLIAAAPDLLAALQDLTAYFGPDTDNGLDELLTNARAAIARATGA